MFKVGDKVKTRDGRDAVIIVDDLKNTYPVWAIVTEPSSFQVVNGYMANGKYYEDGSSCKNDLIIEPEYVWQWLYLDSDGFFQTTGYFKTEELMRENYGKETKNLYRIEESKREVKNG